MNIISNLLGGGNKAQGGQLQVTVVQARQLARKDLFSKSDPYCILRVGRKHEFPLQKHLGTHYKTSVINNNQDPIWNQSFTLPVTNAEQELLRISVYDEDPGFGQLNDDFIGEVDIPLFSLRNGMPKDDWYQLSPASGGAVRLILVAQGFGMMNGQGMMNQQGMGMGMGMPMNQGMGMMGPGMMNQGMMNPGMMNPGMMGGMQAGGMPYQQQMYGQPMPPYGGYGGPGYY